MQSRCIVVRGVIADGSMLDQLDINMLALALSALWPRTVVIVPNSRFMETAGPEITLRQSRGYVEGMRPRSKEASRFLGPGAHGLVAPTIGNGDGLIFRRLFGLVIVTFFHRS